MSNISWLANSFLVAVKRNVWRKQCCYSKGIRLFFSVSERFTVLCNCTQKTVPDKLQFVQVTGLTVCLIIWCKRFMLTELLGTILSYIIDLVSTVAQTTAQYNCQIQLSNRTTKYKTCQSTTKWYEPYLQEVLLHPFDLSQILTSVYFDAWMSGS